MTKIKPAFSMPARLKVMASCFKLLSAGLAVFLMLSCSSTLEEKEEKGKPFPLPEYEANVKFKTLWSKKVGNGQGKQYERLSIALGDDKVCVAAVNGRVACYGKDGSKRWSKGLGEKLLAGTGMNSESVLVVNADGWLIARSTETGEEQWRQNLQSEVLSAPAANDERIVVQNSEGIVIGLSVSGERLWEYKSDEPLLTLRGTAAPVISSGVVYCGFANGKLVALDVDTGVPLWDQAVAIPTGSAEIERLVDVDSSPLIDEQAVFAASYNGYLFQFDRRDGRPRWRTELSTFRTLAQGFGNIYAVDERGRVLAVSAEDGDQQWEYGRLLNRGLSDPVVFDGYVLVADDDGYFHAFSQVDGSLVGRAKKAGRGVRVPMLSDLEQLYVYTNDGRLLAIALDIK